MNQNDIIFFDIESTGANPDTDRIIHIAAVRLPSGGKLEEVREVLMNPGMPIPESAQQVHGITDAMVADKKPFAAYAKALAQFFEGCSVCGYNIRHFDVPLLANEFARAGYSVKFGPILDSYKIYALKERRDLAAAKLFYLGEAHEDAHSAVADTLAAMNIFREQMKRYPELAALSTEDLDTFCNNGVKTLDIAGKIYLNKDGKPTYSFGTKTKDVPVEQNIGFAKWMLDNPFPEDTKRVLREIIAQLITE